ncbi:MAG: amidohydrolase family protein [Haloferacaceae archaeon]
MHLLRGGRVADAAGTRTADVAIADGRIQAVGTDDTDLDPDEAETVTDVSGQFVAPGLIDSHVHVSMGGGPNVETYVDDSAFTASYRAADNLRAALKTGVTTVRDLGSRDTLAIDAGNAVAEGTLEGPRVVAAGENVVMTGGHGHWFGREADGPAEVRKAVREQLKAGADVVKCMATGGVLTSGAQTGAPELTPAELEALVEAANAKAVPTAAHAHGDRGIENAVRAGITSIEHGTFMSRESAELMAERGTFWVPTASALHGIVDHGVGAGIPEEAVDKAKEAAEAFDDAFDNALAAGVTVAMGTDAGTPFNFFAEIPQELQYLVQHGLSPAGALEAATVNAAELLGLDDVGRVAPGYRADLVVLDDDPNEDASVWESPAAVFANGTPVQ